jgi:hypothetical protein
VRRRPVASSIKQHATVAEVATSHRDREILLKKAVASGEKERVIKEFLKGLLSFLIAIAGVYLMWWISKSGGFSYWVGTISGLIIMAVGMAYAAEFVKKLISGDLTRGAWDAIKVSATKEWMKVFVAFVSMISGLCLMLTARRNSLLNEWLCCCVGIVLMAGGITYFWTQSKFRKG